MIQCRVIPPAPQYSLSHSVLVIHADKRLLVVSYNIEDSLEYILKTYGVSPEEDSDYDELKIALFDKIEFVCGNDEEKSALAKVFDYLSGG